MNLVGKRRKLKYVGSDLTPFELLTASMRHSGELIGGSSKSLFCCKSMGNARWFWELQMKRKFSLFVTFKKKFEKSYFLLCWRRPHCCGSWGFRNMDSLIRMRICQQYVRQVGNKEDLLKDKNRKNVARRKYINLIFRKKQLLKKMKNK